MANVWTCLAFCVCIHPVSATISNIAIGKYVGGGRNSERAIDGNLTTFTVVHLDRWWWGDMGIVKDAVVKVFFGPEDTGIPADARLYRGLIAFSPPDGGELCHIVKGRTAGTDIPDITANCTGSWRYIIVYPINTLNLAEIVVSVCTDGTYSDNCSKSCSSRHCAGSSTSCARYTGACSGGCQTGWTGTDCTDCANGIYGASCSKSCSARHCAVSSASCDHHNWACPPGGCRAGWTGTDCTEVCPSGTYGINCSHTCGSRHCLRLAVTCDPVTGQCDLGCTPGWNGTDCSNACPSGTYGQGCSSICGNCSDDTCNHVTGNCSGDCHAGWQGPLCEQVCPLGTFGTNCFPCSTRHCKSMTECPYDGVCVGGCEDGWTLGNCTQACPSGTYGPACSSTCGNCAGDTICHHSTGICTGDCRAGWIGDQCKQILVNGSEGMASVTVGVIGGLVGVIVTLAVVGGLCICLIRQGSLQWNVSKSREPKQSAEMTEKNHSIRPVAQSNIDEVHYSVLDGRRISDKTDYDVIDKKYQNTYQNM